MLQTVVTQGPHGRTHSKQSRIERLVMASQIQRLRDGVGYLQLAGKPVVCRVRIPRVKRALLIEPFAPKKAANVDVPPAPMPAIAPPAPSLPAPAVRRPALDADAILARAAVKE